MHLPGRLLTTRDSRLPGQVAEWLKAHAWKVCNPSKGFEGSNPSLSVLPV
jgi:hypothetical protein